MIRRGDKYPTTATLMTFDTCLLEGGDIKSDFPWRESEAELYS